MISNNWLPQTADAWEPVRKALYPVAHGAVMQPREESEELTDKISKAEDKMVATYGAGEKSPEAEKKARALCMRCQTRTGRCKRGWRSLRRFW